jgi:hypothetical protein
MCVEESKRVVIVRKVNKGERFIMFLLIDNGHDIQSIRCANVSAIVAGGR